MRQLYVAFTRAKLQLYVPIALHLPSEQIEKGEASPIDLLLARLNYPARTYEQIYESMRSYSGQNLIDFLDQIGSHHFMTYSIHQELKCEPLASLSAAPPFLEPPQKMIVHHEPFRMFSFSTLSRHKTILSSGSPSSSLMPPHDYLCSDKTVHHLPANSETGLLIHSILEKLDFKEFHSSYAPNRAMGIVRSFVQKTAFKEWEAVIFEIINHTLNTPLFIDSVFCLADLEPSKTYREMPFIYPYHLEPFLEEIGFKNGMMKGVLDLLFYHEERYYLVDWKTNWLGPSIDAYDKKTMQRAMQENTYDLQALLYVEAIKRYLNIVDPRPFEECFGGVFYLFLRGISPKKKTGILFFNKDVILNEP
jgi:exodeoxyribonuclease V beta subunit